MPRFQAMRNALLITTALCAACGKGGGNDTAKGNDPEANIGGGGGGTAGGGGKGGGKALVAAPSRGAEHMVYSLVDNRLAAHVERGGGLLIPAGSAGFAKYIRFGNPESSKRTWDMQQKEGDVKVGRMVGSSARVDVPLTTEMLAGNPVVRVRAYSADARAISVRVNERKESEVNANLAAGWGVTELPVSADLLKDGDNQLQFFVGGKGLSVEWIQVGGSAPADGATDFYDAASKSLVIPDGGAMSWYLFVPDKGLITADLDDGACEVAVKAVGENGTVVEGKLTGTGSGVDLAQLGGKAARLSLTTSGCPKAKLSNAGLVVPGEQPKATRGAAPKYVVLLIMDSLRADRVRVFNPEARPEVPNWEKLAEDSAVFLQTYVQGNESRVSHASLWPSAYPLKHSMFGSQEKLKLEFTTVDEVAKSAGMFTAGASANGYVQPQRWGFGQKWDKFTNHIAEEKGLKAPDILEAGWRFVADKKEPWFLYMGFVDTHVSWRAKDPWTEKYDPGYTGRFKDTFSGGDAGNARAGKLQMTDREKEHVRALYDSNVSSQDEVLGQLVQKLQDAGIYDQTMIIITADHGDEQWEADDRVGHGGSTRDMLIHVPLLIHYPALLPAGKYVEGAESVDIVPTIADALGVPLDPEWQGESLIPLTEGVGQGYPRLSFNSMYEDEHAGRILHWKARIKGGNAPKVFDFSSDPDEMKDLWESGDAEIGARAVLDPLWTMRAFNMEWKKSQWGNAANVSARFAADLGE